MTWLQTDTIERLRGARVSSGYGDDQVADWANPETVVIRGCSVQPASGPEYVVDRESIVSRWELYAPYGTDLRGGDRVRWQGVTYDIDGAPQPFRDPTGSGLDHTFALLREV